MNITNYKNCIPQIVMANKTNKKKAENSRISY